MAKRDRRNEYVFTRVPEKRRAKRGYRQEFMQGYQMHVAFFPWTHYDLACDYLQRNGIDRRNFGQGCLNDVGEVLVNFSEEELRAILAQPQEE